MITIQNEKSFLLIKKIVINNYKTYQNTTIEFVDNITTLVGPNECGKTNLLEALNFLIDHQKLKKSDTCLYCKNYWNEKPNFIYYLDSNQFGFKNSDSDLKVIVKLNNVEIEKPPDVSTKQTFIKMHRVFFPKGGGGHIHVNFPPNIQTNYDLPEMVTIKEGEYYDIKMLSKTELEQLNDFNKNTNLYNKLSIQEVNSIEPSLFDDNEDYMNEIFKKVKVIYWTFDQNKFIQDMIDINALNKNPQQYKYILNMLKITGIEQNQFFQAEDIQRINMINQINEKITKLIKDSWKQYNIEFNLSLGRTNNLLITFRENGQNIEPGKRSEGFKWFFSFLLDFNAKFGSDISNSLILLDEPGIHLHPGGQRMLLKQLEDLSKSNQIIYTTHLPFMINRMFPERIIYLNKVNGITQLINPRKEGIFDDILLSLTLGFEFTSLSNWGEINIFVEGITDKILIKKIVLEKANKDKEIILDLNNFSLIPLNGVNNLENFIRVAQETDAKYLVFLDGDKEAKGKCKKYEKKPKSHPTTIEHIIFLENDKTIEDYIPLDLLNKALNTLKTLKRISYSNYIDEWKFNENSIVGQIKDFTAKINSNIEEKESLTHSNDYNEEEITPQDLKFDLIIQVKNLINSGNIDLFKDLIHKLRNISKKANELYNL